MRVVLDTNVIISGLLWKGKAKVLFDLIERGNITLCLTPKILEEIKRVLSYPQIKKQLEKYDIKIEEIIFLVLNYAEIFPDLEITNPIKEDPSDNMFINCALISDSKIIVSGDKHLLNLKTFSDIKILTIRNFLESFYY